MKRGTPHARYERSVADCTAAVSSQGAQTATPYRARLATGPAAHPAEKTKRLHPVTVPVPPEVRCWPMDLARELLGGCSEKTANLPHGAPIAAPVKKAPPTDAAHSARP